MKGNARCNATTLIVLGLSLCIPSLLASCATVQEQPVKLEYKLQAGDVLEYQTEVPGNGLKIEGREILICTDVSEDGILKIAHLQSGIRMAETQIDGKDMAQIAARKDIYSPFFSTRAASYLGYDTLSGSSQIRVDMRRNGKVVASTFGQEEDFPRHFAFFTPLGEYVQSLGDLAFGLPVIQFPDTPIKVGESWIEKSWIEKGDAASDSPKYTLVGFKKVKGYSCAEIRLKYSGPRSQIQITLFFAPEEGFFVKENAAFEYTNLRDRKEQHILTSELVRHKKLSQDELQRVQQEMAKAQQEVPERRKESGSIPREASSEETLVGNPAPDFRLKDLSGKYVSLTNFNGKVILLNFWTTSLPASIQMIPHFVELNRQYEGQGLSMVGIALEQEAERPLGLVESVVERDHVNYPILLSEGEVHQTYSPNQKIPITFLIDIEGKVRRVYEGYWTKTEFEADIKKMLERRSLSQEGAGAPTEPSEDSLTIVSYDPPLPATLNLGERLMITIDYTIDSVDQARIWARPYTGGVRTQGYGAHGSPSYGKGERRLVGWFTFKHPTTVDEVRVKMVADSTNIVTSVAQQIEAQWREE